MNILLTAFEPFAGATVNASWEAVRALDGSMIGDATVRVRCLPCVFGEATPAMDRAIDALRPSLIVATGEASSRSEITPERIAVNLDDARIACNGGHQPCEQPVVPGAPAAYFSTLPVAAMARAIVAAGVPASVSGSAGSYVCNHLFFALMHRLATRGPAGVRGGFVHLPRLACMPGQAARAAGETGLPLCKLVDGLRMALIAAWSAGSTDSLQTSA